MDAEVEVGIRGSLQDGIMVYKAVDKKSDLCLHRV